MHEHVVIARRQGGYLLSGAPRASCRLLLAAVGMSSVCTTLSELSPGQDHVLFAVSLHFLNIRVVCVVLP